MRDSTAQRLLTASLPVDRVAARVVKKARPEDLWRPAVKIVESKAFSREVIATKPPPKEMPAADLAKIARGRRDRLVVVGYAAKQGSQSQNAKWVVRCDCGNYEERTRILRWLGTKAPDMCEECRVRNYKKLQKLPADLPPAERPFAGPYREAAE